jgi:glutathione S-transferase
MKLVSSNTSPYARKVRIALHEKNLHCELIEDTPWNPDSCTSGFNPLEKLPILVLDSGETVYDSRYILEWLERSFEIRATRHTWAVHSPLLHALWADRPAAWMMQDSTMGGMAPGHWAHRRCGRRAPASPMTRSSSREVHKWTLAKKIEHECKSKHT